MATCSVIWNKTKLKKFYKTVDLFLDLCYYRIKLRETK